MKIHYKVVIYWSPEDEAYLAEVPELTGCVADGMYEPDWSIDQVKTLDN
jgi:hypothetical protein